MLYINFKEKKLSSLGFGAMRLPITDGGDSDINVAAAEEMVACAMEHGINYYDTAWGYHGGNSERVMGAALSKYKRESFYLASKFPGYDNANMTRVEEIFEEQLKKCRVEYFDFYLFHNVCEKNIDGYLNAEYGIFDYLIEQKKNGRIRHLGFSSHGNLATVERFLLAYGEHMEFCQLQLNYLDWSLQRVGEKLELLKKYGIPVWVMEPLRGGSLAKLSDEDEAVLKKLRPNESIAAWAFRYLQTLPEVGVTLSGMSDMQQLEENIRIFSENKPLNAEESAVLSEIADKMLKQKTLPCTACHYCVSHCPQGLDIPWLLSLYNDYLYSDGGFLAPMGLEALSENKKPSACIGCKSCEAVCPQGIKIASAMTDFSEKVK